MQLHQAVHALLGSHSVSPRPRAELHLVQGRRKAVVAGFVAQKGRSVPDPCCTMPLRLSAMQGVS